MQSYCMIVVYLHYFSVISNQLFFFNCLFFFRPTKCRLANNEEDISSDIENVSASSLFGDDTDDNVANTPRSTKQPLNKKRRRTGGKTQDDELMERVLKNLEDTNVVPTEDALTVFGKHIVMKLRQITDRRILALVQNEIEQVCFRGVMKMMETTQPTQSSSTPQSPAPSEYTGANKDPCTFSFLNLLGSQDS